MTVQNEAPFGRAQNNSVLAFGSVAAAMGAALRDRNVPDDLGAVIAAVCLDADNALSASRDDLDSAYRMVTARDRIIAAMRRRVDELFGRVSPDLFDELTGGHSVRVEVVQ